ncbi:conserved Plasmodium protein, unknown function [Plasmodium berghei]|uniref:Uncharacterized protein n=2 Tax=Plasmodium berghei TaxID=5821 RepID=A0A509AUS3_PLABA|nr:conserved Plasmodium protein, unknown function [Plasmodium berghei ANKA]CXJ21780.1 conserved Plasmodium protein, unknown function [Plasmodium berghei]SCM26618.1 conserved Plasmodium protein, unknown function [Plasmodium berghei]SCN28550.1 conserved Plasmodium protein, unknown function [Plasmodium berghei]SCO62739.1 conserved Plasmodium protein, unknown function [Plasmodium berghei]SCO64299.1 conserved Plasmodium protein, unknown function [Plasmodium berghei]|eukprot:XP_034424195.1 conserved Plasmodium protein, unknown function [Plasmodium berghei ANKA]
MKGEEMLELVIDFILTLIVDIELYICIFILLVYLVNNKINKVTKFNFYKSDSLLKKLAKNFYIVELKADFSPTKYVFKNILYHIYYSIVIFTLIYLFRLYTINTKDIQNPYESDDYFSVETEYTNENNSELHSIIDSGMVHFLAFIFGSIISVGFYTNICKLFKRNKKYVSIQKYNLLKYSMDIAKADFKDYLKKPTFEKGTKFKLNLGKTLKISHKINSEFNKQIKNASAESKNGIMKLSISSIFYILFTKKHVLYDEQFLYDSSTNDNAKDENQLKEKGKLCVVFDMISKVIMKKRSLKTNGDTNTKEVNAGVSTYGENKEGFNQPNSHTTEKIDETNKNDEINETDKNQEHKETNENSTKLCTEFKDKINMENVLNNELIIEQVKKELDMKNKKNIIADDIKNAQNMDVKLTINNIKLCDINEDIKEVYNCYSYYYFKSPVEICMLYLPMFFFFKNKLYLKLFFTLWLYIINWIVWNIITFMSMLMPSLYAYYYLFNEHIISILSENISQQEKNTMLQFFFGFFVSSLVYFKYYLNTEFKLIKNSHVEYFQALIATLLDECYKLRSQKIIKNFENLKIFPLNIDYQNKGIFLDKSLLLTPKELEKLEEQKQLRKNTMLLKNIGKIAKYCDKNTANQIAEQIKLVLLKEVPQKVALNISHHISHEIYTKIKNNDDKLESHINTFLNDISLTIDPKK